MKLILKIFNAFYELIAALFKVFIMDGESCKERDKRIERQIFNDEAETNGLDGWEKDECMKGGMTPEEWAEENNPDYKE